MSATGELRRPEAGEVPPPAGWHELLRTAYLLTADHGEAEELAVAALVRAGRRRWWNRGPADPRRLVLTLPASPARRLAAGRPRVAGQHDDPFLRAYRALPPGGRALLVLRVADGLDEQAAATAVGFALQRTRAETVAALDALRPSSADRARAGAAAVELDHGEMSGARHADAPGEGAPDAVDPADPVVRALARMFEGLEAHPPVTARPAQRVALAATRARRRRRTAALLGATAALLVATGAGLAARQHARDEAARVLAARERALDALLHPLVLGSDVSTWPTRGSHAGDMALLAQIRRRSGAGVGLPFAGRVGDLDVALVYAGAADQARLFVLHGPAGSPPADWAEDDGVPSAIDLPVLSAAISDDAGLVHLVVVTLSRGVSAAWSPAPRISDDATVAREYRAFRLEDGTGTAVAGGDPRRFALRLEGGSTTSIGGFDVRSSTTAPGGAERLPVAVSAVPSCARLAVADDTPALVDQALGQAGIGAAEVTGIRQLWCRRTGDVAALALTVTATHGPDVQCYETAIRTDAGLGFDRECWPVPRGLGRSAAFVAPPVPEADTAASHELTVWAPGAARLEVRSPRRGDRVVARAVVAPDGYAGVAVPVGQVTDDLAVVILGTTGRETLRLPAMRTVDRDSWGYGLDGPVLGAEG